MINYATLSPATSWLLTPGAFVTTTPHSAAVLLSIPSTPTPCLAITFKRGQERMIMPVDAAEAQDQL